MSGALFSPKDDQRTAWSLRQEVDQGHGLDGQQALVVIIGCDLLLAT